MEKLGKNVRLATWWCGLRPILTFLNKYPFGITYSQKALFTYFYQISDLCKKVVKQGQLNPLPLHKIFRNFKSKSAQKRMKSDPMRRKEINRLKIIKVYKKCEETFSINTFNKHCQNTVCVVTIHFLLWLCRGKEAKTTEEHQKNGKKRKK